MRVDYHFIQRAHELLGINIPNPAGIGKDGQECKNELEVYVYENKWNFCTNQYCVIKPISGTQNNYRVYFDKNL